MITVALIFAGLAALLHVYIFVMESLTWTTPRTRAVFGTTAEEAQTTKMLAFNLTAFTTGHIYGRWFNGRSDFDISRDEFVVLISNKAI